MLRRSVSSLLVGIAIAAACGGDAATAPESIAGIYTLQTIDGQPPPRTISEDANGRTEILGARALLDDDGSFHGETDIRTTSAGVTSTGTFHSFGTYVRTGEAVSVDLNGGDSYSMTVSGRTLTWETAGGTLVYRR